MYVYDLYLIVSKFKVIHKNVTCLDSFQGLKTINYFVYKPFRHHQGKQALGNLISSLLV